MQTSAATIRRLAESCPQPFQDSLLWVAAGMRAGYSPERYRKVKRQYAGFDTRFIANQLRGQVDFAVHPSEKGAWIVTTQGELREVLLTNEELIESYRWGRSQGLLRMARERLGLHE